MTIKPIALYPTTVYQAQMMSETGTRYTLAPWTTDTGRIKGESGEPDRVLILADDVTLYLGQYGDIIAERPTLSGQVISSPCELDHLVTEDGRIIDGAWGHTRKLKPGEEYTTADDIAARLEE